MNGFKVVCIDDTRKPNGISQNNWLQKDETYTVTHVQVMARQAGVYGFRLKEIQPDQKSGYDSYNSNRFRPYTEDDAEAERAVMKLMEEVDELQLQPM